MARAVLDASAVLALLRAEPGAERVADYVGDALLSAVNAQETLKALLQRGVPAAIAEEMLGALHLEIIPHDREQASAAAQLWEATSRFGGGIGDRSCLALALSQGLPAITADREWARLSIDGLEVIVLR